MTDHSLNQRIVAAGIELDTTMMTFEPTDPSVLEGHVANALSAMRALEEGAIANPDENRRVGHYWLRNPALAPEDLRSGIEQAREAVSDFARNVRKQNRFCRFLLIGIGGSALGPQMVYDALRLPGSTPELFALDNTDPTGMQRVFDDIGSLDDVLCIVVSKGGSTRETQNGMAVAEAQWSVAGLKFSDHAVAVTGVDSLLDRLAIEQNWLARFPIEDWVGGRTSLFSPVGLLPAALLGFNIERMLQGASEMDEATRRETAQQNPAMLMALAWHSAVELSGRGNLVILPYCDRLVLFSRYLQQLVMESLGKDGHGITVFGNKGSTDQHSYIQQLREGTPDFTALFLQPLRQSTDWIVEQQTGVSVTVGDYLAAFLDGTQTALTEADRPSMRLCFEQVDEYCLGALIALFERSVGFYASLIGINAYHQPGVQAGKLAAGEVIELQVELVSFLNENRGQEFNVAEIAAQVNRDPVTVHDMLRRLAIFPQSGVTSTGSLLGYSASRLFKGTAE